MANFCQIRFVSLGTALYWHFLFHPTLCPYIFPLSSGNSNDTSTRDTQENIYRIKTPLSFGMCSGKGKGLICMGEYTHRVAKRKWEQIERVRGIFPDAFFMPLKGLNKKRFLCHFPFTFLFSVFCLFYDMQTCWSGRKSLLKTLPGRKCIEFNCVSHGKSESGKTRLARFN